MGEDTADQSSGRVVRVEAVTRGDELDAGDVELLEEGEAAGIAGEKKSPLFRTLDRNQQLTEDEITLDEVERIAI